MSRVSPPAELSAIKSLARALAVTFTSGAFRPPKPAPTPGAYVIENPAAVFFFEFFWSGTQPITIGMVLNQTPARAMAIYITSASQQYRLNADQVTISTAIISLPAPASLVPVAIAAAIYRRRTRKPQAWA